MKAVHLVFAVLLALVLSGNSVEEAGARLSSPLAPMANPRLLVGFDADVGSHGYVVVAWVQRRSTNTKGSALVSFARVKRPGDRKFGRPTRLGPASNGAIDVEIGSTDLAVVAWPGKEGYLRYVTGRPRSSWASSRWVGGTTSLGVKIAVGPDGTILASNLAGSIGREDRVALVATKSPGDEDFTPWRVVSSDVPVGTDLGVVAGRNGEGTVAWSGLCPTDTDGDPAYYVDIDDQSASDPIKLSNSKCTVWDLDLQTDARGRQYLLIGTWTGLRFAAREPDSPFPQMSNITTSYMGGPGDLSVSATGRGTLTWTRSDRSGYPRSNRYVTFNGSKPLGQTRILRGPRTNPEQVRDYLMDSAALPDGSLLNLWTLTWKENAFQIRNKFGLSRWVPGQKFNRPRYNIPIGRSLTPYPVKVETANDGSQLAWWIETDDRNTPSRVRVIVGNWRRNSAPATN